MATPNSRSTLKEYCLRKLGFPVIELNLDDDQIEDRMDEALSLYRQFHFDAVEKTYIKHLVTAGDVANTYVSVSDNVIGINRIFSLSATQVGAGGQLNFNMFDLTYQLRLNELYDFTSADYVYFSLANQHLRTMEMLFIGEVPIRFNRHMKKLFIDWAWGASEAPAGTIVIAECYACIDATVYNRVWNDLWIKKYTTALFKRTWANNLKKFSGIQLPGGVTLNGDKIYEEAVQEIEKLEDEMENNFSLPVEWYMN